MDLSDLSNHAGHQPVGIYTKTVVPSSVIRWILHARIRHRRLNDVVFVGEDFIHVKHVGKEGHLLHVATKADFDARIRAATTFHHTDHSAHDDFLVKLEKDAASFHRDAGPPQCLVLTLDSNDLVFVFLRLHDDGTSRFVQQTCPMPSFDRILFQPGEHVAVDPFSRAIAVAANDTHIILYATKPKDQVRYEIKQEDKDWCPVSAQKPMQVDGVIQHIDFLIPPADDPDHIILLLIVVHQHRTKAIRIDWHYSTGPRRAQLHPAQALESAQKVSNLLIPLQEAAFLLVTGNEITLWKNILSGSATEFGLPQPTARPKYPGISAYAPVWASWAKPRRSQAARSNNDFIYLVREDGLVLLITIPKTTPTAPEQSIAGDVDCHVGTAFASLGDEGDPDILCVAGSASSGKVVSMGNWPSTRRIEEMSRLDTMNMEVIEVLPNWASVTDMVCTHVLHSGRSRNQDQDSILVTSGKQPFGNVTDIRRGVEARLSVFLELEGLRTVTDVWVLPDLSLGATIIVLSSPDSTRLLAAGADFESLEEIAYGSAFDSHLRTLAAGLTSSGHLVQITERTICASTAAQTNFEDTSKHSLPEDHSIVASWVIPSDSVVVNAERQEGGHAIACYHITSTDTDRTIHPGPTLRIPYEPLDITAVSYHGSILTLTATNDGKIALVYFPQGSAPLCYAKDLSSASEDTAICDNVSILEANDQLLAVCGLRDGRVVGIEVDLDAEEPLSREHSISLGHSTVKLVHLAGYKRSSIAMTASSTYLLSWSGGSASSLTCENIWVTDKARPELSQGTITACAQMPSANYLSSDTLADALMMISQDELLVADLEHKSSTVPRQIAVSSTPNRVVYAEALRQIVCCGLVAEARKCASRPQSAPEEKRQIWPRLEFIPAKGSEPTYTHDMQPGERVNAILPWSLRASTDKTYSHILIGGSYLRTNGKRRGKVTFLQPLVRKSQVWEISEIRESRATVFDEEVHSLALYDDTTYIACAGDSVHIQRLSVEESRWDKICPPFKMASPGVHVTVEKDGNDEKFIVISTSADSLIVLRLLETREEDGTTRCTLLPMTMGPRADLLISHLIVPSLEPNGDNSALFSLASTKYGRLLGMMLPVQTNANGASPSAYHSGTMCFEAQLTRSLTRMSQNPPPMRKGAPPAGIIAERVTGSATDGAVVNVALLDSTLWRKLFWLQRLIERSEKLSPHCYSDPPYTSGEEGMTGESRALPVGFGGDVAVAMSTTNSKLNDYHIDGDVLARALLPHAPATIKSVLVHLSGEDGAVGDWVRAHLEAEIAAIEETISIVKKIDDWM
ncbi:hypothetical protein AC579_7541 [Pseudocercospora musae]|uniref:Uncharacterized protein n=1 Tax=Pseudocercospora musae TaxID=113226 RepID=A0A139II34_9PEZI|nr:hypothetical protein AC579_7541 [Pseudocercospora musae]